MHTKMSEPESKGKEKIDDEKTEKIQDNAIDDDEKTEKIQDNAIDYGHQSDPQIYYYVVSFENTEKILNEFPRTKNLLLKLEHFTLTGLESYIVRLGLPDDQVDRFSHVPDVVVPLFYNAFSDGIPLKPKETGCASSSGFLYLQTGPITQVQVNSGKGGSIEYKLAISTFRSGYKNQMCVAPECDNLSKDQIIFNICKGISNNIDTLCLFTHCANPKCIDDITKAFTDHIGSDISYGTYCAQCMKPNPMNRCSRCKILYCNSECQEKHWEVHQPLCRANIS